MISAHYRETASLYLADLGTPLRMALQMREAVRSDYLSPYWKDTLDQYKPPRPPKGEGATPQAPPVPKGGDGDIASPPIGGQGGLKEKYILLRRDEAAAHGELAATPDRARRAELAHRIMDVLRPEQDRIWKRLRSGETDEPIPVEADNPDDIIGATVKKMQRLNSLSVRISMLKKFLANPKTDPKKRIAYDTELLEKQAEHHSLKLKLGI